MARTCRGMRTSRHKASSRVAAGTVMASHSGGHRHHPRRTNTSGADRTSMAAMLARAHSTRRTVTYFGDTRSQVIPGGSIAAVGILAFPLGLAPAAARQAFACVRLAILRRDLVKAFDDEPHHDHGQPAPGHPECEPG